MPKKKPLVVIADKLAQSTVDALGTDVDIMWVDGPNRAELLPALAQADALLVRSATTVDAEVYEHAPLLKIVARAGVGLDNVDVPKATERGITVVNAPTSNIHSAAEHAVALLLAVLRQIPRAHQSLQEHTWKRSSFMGTELFGKTVGVVGLGRIGQLVAGRLAAFGTRIVGYDPFVTEQTASHLGVDLVDFETLLAISDIITVHLPKTPQTTGMISDAQFAQAKKGLIIINAARGGLIDEDALVRALDQGVVAGAGLDVFSQEPCTDHRLFDHPGVVVTPHLGGSTREAQDRAGIDVAQSVQKVLAGEFVPQAVNVTGGFVDEIVQPWIDLTTKIARLLAVVVRGGVGHSPISSVEITVLGELSEYSIDVLELAALRGIVVDSAEETVSFVNVGTIAASRGIRARLEKSPLSPLYRSAVDVSVVCTNGTRSNVTGTIMGDNYVPKIVNINGRNFDLRAQGHNLIASYQDKPGSLGVIGTHLGAHGIDIQAAGVAQDTNGYGATIILRVNKQVPETCEQAIAQGVDASMIGQVTFDAP